MERGSRIVRSRSSKWCGWAPPSPSARAGVGWAGEPSARKIPSRWPAYTDGFGLGYIIGAILLNLVLVRKVADLRRDITRPKASSLFHYSMIYLALLFLAMAVDRALT